MHYLFRNAIKIPLLSLFLSSRPLHPIWRRYRQFRSLKSREKANYRSRSLHQIKRKAPTRVASLNSGTSALVSLSLSLTHSREKRGRPDFSPTRQSSSVAINRSRESNDRYFFRAPSACKTMTVVYESQPLNFLTCIYTAALEVDKRSSSVLRCACVELHCCARERLFRPTSVARARKLRRKLYLPLVIAKFR